MSITDERKKRSTSPTSTTTRRRRSPCRRIATIKGVTEEDLAGKTIGAQGSTTHSTYAEKTCTDSEIKGYPTADEFLLDLANGRLDAAVDDVVVLSATGDRLGRAPAARSSAPSRRSRRSTAPAPASPSARATTSCATSSTPAIEAIRANGKYKEINDKYFKFDVYGG